MSSSSNAAGGAGTSTGGGGQGAGGQGAGGQGVGGQGGATNVNILFVGNSYIFVNDLPNLIKAIDPGGPTIEVNSVTVGGASMGDHVSTTGAMAAIAEGGYSHVVLQGQSVEPLLAPNGFFTASATLSAAVVGQAAQPVFFETWARQAGHAVYQESWSGGTPAAMQSGLRLAYQQAADDGGGVMAPAGDAYETALAEQPAITLFQNDGSHPSVAGSYLTAAVMYLVITKQQDFVAPGPAPIDETDAASLRAIAKAQLGLP